MAHLWPTKMHSSLAWRCPLQPIVPLYRFDPAAWASSLHGYSCGQESERQWKAKTVIVLPPPPAIAAPQERALYLGLKSGPTSCVQMCGACVFRELSCCFVLKDELPSHLLKTLSDIGCSLESIHGFSQSQRGERTWAVSVNLGDFKPIKHQPSCFKNQAGLVQKLRM